MVPAGEARSETATPSAGPEEGEPGGLGRRVVSLAWKEAPSNAVIREQVVERANALREAGFDSRVVFGLRPADLGSVEGLGAHVTAVRAGGFASLVSLARRTMSPGVASGPSPILICRGALVAAAALVARGRRQWILVHDARAWYVADSIDKGEGSLRRGAKRLVERRAFRGSDHTVVVSQALVGIGLMLGADAARLTVIPPWVGGHDGEADDGAIAPADVLYVGDTRHPYQPRSLVEPVLRGIAAALPERTVGWLDSAADREAEWLTSNLWRRSVPFERVGSHLSRASVALLIRRPSPNNATAVPTKAAQYLVAGCRLVTSSSPPSIAELCRVTGRGRVVGSFDPDEWARAVEEALSADRGDGLELRAPILEAWRALLESL